MAENKIISLKIGNYKDVRGHLHLGPLSGIILNKEITYPKIKTIVRLICKRLELIKAVGHLLDSKRNKFIIAFAYEGGKVNAIKYLGQKDGTKVDGKENLLSIAARHGNFNLVKYKASKGFRKEEISKGLDSSVVGDEPKIFK